VNNIYDTARFKFATAGLNWNTAPLFLLAYSGNPDFHAEDGFISDITTRATTTFVQQSQAIIGKNVSPQGYLQTGTVMFEEVPIGLPITHFIMASVPAALSAGVPLLFFDEAYDLPFTPNGLDIPVTPDWFQQRGWGRL